MINSGSRGTTRVSFVCQKCSQPLRLDQSSFSSIDEDTISEITREFKVVSFTCTNIFRVFDCIFVIFLLYKCCIISLLEIHVTCTFSFLFTVPLPALPVVPTEKPLTKETNSQLEVASLSYVLLWVFYILIYGEMKNIGVKLCM